MSRNQGPQLIVFCIERKKKLSVGTDLAEPCYVLLIFYSSAHRNMPLDNKLFKAGICKAFSVFTKLHK